MHLSLFKHEILGNALFSNFLTFVIRIQFCALRFRIIEFIVISLIAELALTKDVCIRRKFFIKTDDSFPQSLRLLVRIKGHRINSSHNRCLWRRYHNLKRIPTVVSSENPTLQPKLAFINERSCCPYGETASSGVCCSMNFLHQTRVSPLRSTVRNWTDYPPR